MRTEIFQRSLVSLAAFLCFACFPRTASAAVIVTPQLDRATIMTGEAVALTISVQGGNPQSAENFPPVPGLTIQYRGTGQKIVSVNGQTTVEHMLNYAVTASQPGQFTIPSIKITVDGTAHPTQPLKLTVTKPDPNIQNRYAFLRLNVPKNEFYVGEIVPIELQLYVTDAENLEPPQLKSDGFIIHKRLEHRRSQAQIGNAIYTVLTFPMAISAAKAGQLQLGPAEMNLVLRLRAQPDPNDLFGMFGRFQRRPMTATSPTVDINVLPLPSPAPTNFTGAIGTFQWRVEASPTNLNSGEPITLRTVIAGRGNFDNVKLPELNWPNFRTYQPNSTATPSDQMGLEGSKTFEQVIVPQNASPKEIPPLSFPYFDPAKKSFVTLTHPAIPLQIRAGPGAALPQTASAAASDSEEQQPARADIVHIKTEPGPLATISPPLLRQPLFLLAQAIPIAAVIGLTLWRKRQDAIAANPKLRRKLEVQQVVHRGLADLRHFAANNDAEQFYATLFRLMQEQIGERLDLPASAITEAVLDERLPKRGASQDLIDRLHYLFQIANQARYAPVRTDAELLSLCSDLENALAELQQLPD